MAQLIEVRCVNPENIEQVLFDEFTKASSHREAVELALDAFSGGIGRIKSLERLEDVKQGQFIGDPSPCWRYVYRLVLLDEDGVSGREAWAALFTQYREKDEQ